MSVPYKKLIEDFGMQLRDALKIGNSLKLTKPEKGLYNVVVAGIGSSGVGANMVQAFVQSEINIPLIVEKGYHIPNFINEHTLFIASSFSGNTEETMQQLEKAVLKKAKIVCITNGGLMLEYARLNKLDYVRIPGETAAKRYSIGYSIVQLLGVLNYYCFISNQYINQVLDLTQYISRNAENIKKQAEKLALKIQDKLPVIYADSALESIILRVQQQINENAKQLCHINTMPEMNHNELMGWDNPQNKLLSRSIVILIRTDFEHPRVQHRIDLCKPIFSQTACEVIEITGIGKTFIEQSLYLIHFFDWVSYYLAKLNQVDPYQLNMVNHLKDELAKIR